MKVRGIEYDYWIEPRNGSVTAFIVREKVTAENLKEDLKTTLVIDTKSFGKWYRSIRSDDYKKAKEWAERQLMDIYHANKE